MNKKNYKYAGGGKNPYKYDVGGVIGGAIRTPLPGEVVGMGQGPGVPGAPTGLGDVIACMAHYAQHGVGTPCAGPNEERSPAPCGPCMPIPSTEPAVDDPVEGPGETTPCPQPTSPDPSASHPSQGPMYQWNQGTCQWEVIEQAGPTGPTVGTPPIDEGNWIGDDSWWQDMDKLNKLKGARGRAGRTSQMQVRGPIKEGGTTSGGASEDIKVEERNPLLMRGNPYIYKNVVGFKHGGKIHDSYKHGGNMPFQTNEQLHSYSEAVKQLAYGLHDSMAKKARGGKYIKGGKY